MTALGASWRACALVGLLALAAAPLGAQRLAGTVVRPDSATPAARALVEWRTPTTAVRRLATDDAGRFVIVLERADSVLVRVLRPGFRPQVLLPVAVPVDSTVTLHVVLHAEAVTLAPLRVEEHRVCGPRGEAVAWTLWEQARVALQSVVLAERDPALRIEGIEFDAEVTADDALVVRDSSLVRVAGDPRRPAAHYDSLFRFGYVRRVADTTTYFTPTLPVIADDRFAEHYCFRRVVDEARYPDWTGVEFEPARRPGPGVADVAGTFWLDRDHLLLHAVEFRYVNVPVHHRIDGIGGEMRFAGLSSGHWILSEWSVRLPRLSLFAGYDRAPTGRWGRGRRVYRVRLGDDTLFADAAAAALARRALAPAP